ncbi:MAG: CvpA family protein [Anaerolineae bacterium]|nr:CvpA family protein [Anaerolineae bacterium]
MIEIYSMTWIVAIFFGIIGMIRGWSKELVSLAGIILAMFALFQFDSLLRGVFLASVPHDQAFFVQIGLFGVIVYFAYQTRAPGVSSDRGGPRRGRWQDAVLGGMLGALNGYLIWGAAWYFLDINNYPLSPLIIAPAPGGISDRNLGTIPLVLLGGAAGGSTELLTIIVIVLFLFVLFML